MEKRIRIIWILSLVSAMLLIGVQGYWLYNQYQYVADNYLQELSVKILEAGDEEYRIRKANVESFYTYFVDRSTYMEQNDSNAIQKNKLLFSITKKENFDSDTLVGDITNQMKDKIQILRRVDSLRINPHGEEKDMPADANGLNLSWNTNLSDKDLHAGIDRAVTNFSNPFQEALLDSILTSDLPEFHFSIAPWSSKDTLDYTSNWKKAGTVFYPKIQVSYAYSPIQKQGVFIYADIPSQPLLKQMAIQLALAAGLVILLIGCLMFQIKTILKQKKLSELRESFVNTMIHELKRPVQTLKTFVSFLGDKEMRGDEAVTEQVVQDSMFELDNLSAYLGKLKDMLRADNEQTPLHPLKFNLQELAEKVIRLTNIPAEKEVKLSAEYEMESPWIEADPLHIANILSNLIENAVKYSGSKVAVSILARQKGKELWLTVTDNGIGIPFAEQERVFAKFYRGTNIPDRNIPGIGLGLSYVKLITEAHHGNVSLVSQNGEGTSVTLFIPQ